jgi:hypothetical protein
MYIWSLLIADAGLYSWYLLSSANSLRDAA